MNHKMFETFQSFDDFKICIDSLSGRYHLMTNEDVHLYSSASYRDCIEYIDELLDE